MNDGNPENGNPENGNPENGNPENGNPEQVYHPSAAEPVPGGLYCFKDQARVCGPECMAYLPQPPPQPIYKGEQWAHCMVLLCQERESRHVVIIATELTSLRKRSEAERLNAQKPPTPK